MMRCIGLFIGCLFSLNIYADKYVIGAQNLAYFPHYDFASSTDKGVAWSILEERQFTIINYEKININSLKITE